MALFSRCFPVRNVIYPLTLSQLRKSSSTPMHFQVKNKKTKQELKCSGTMFKSSASFVCLAVSNCCFPINN